MHVPREITGIAEGVLLVFLIMKLIDLIETIAVVHIAPAWHLQALPLDTGFLQPGSCDQANTSDSHHITPVWII